MDFNLKFTFFALNKNDVKIFLGFFFYFQWKKNDLIDTEFDSSFCFCTASCVYVYQPQEPANKHAAQCQE